MHLRDLRDKYATLKALRLARARARPGTPPPREELQRLAARFPGALREIDRLAPAVLDARLAALDAALHGHAAPAPWMTAQLAFHRHARAVLAAKRWLGGRREIAERERQAFRVAHPEEAWLADELARIARPPRGRVMGLVHALVARELGVSEDEARRLALATE